MITYKKGNLFNLLPKTLNKVLIPHVCNNEGGFGSGFAGEVARRYPAVKDAYRTWFASGKDFELGQIQIVPQEGLTFANMIGQHRTINSAPRSTPIRYAALLDCMRKVEQWCQANGPVEIHAPKFGSGLAKGNWDFIELLIEEIWVANNIPVTIYEL